MRIGAPATADLEQKAMGKFVRILCDVRLAALALNAVAQALGQPGVATLIVLLALPFSWFPLRYWEERSSQILSSRILLLSDVVMTLIVTIVLRAATDQSFAYSVYLVVSLVLWSMALSLRLFWTAFSVVLGLLALWVWALEDGELAEFFLLAAACGAAGWVGRQIRRTVELEALRAREAVDQRAEQAAIQERMLLGQEMHDSLAKTVHGISLLAQSLAMTLERENPEHAQRALLIHDACTDALSDTREILSGLRDLAHDSLAVAVRLEVERFRIRSGLRVKLEVEEDHRVVVAPEASWAIVRILGELLANVENHAAASDVSITLNVDSFGLILLVADDGKGMSIDGGTLDASRLALEGHYGLIGVQERAEALGGVVRVLTKRSYPSGTTVDVRIPAEGERNNCRMSSLDMSERRPEGEE